MSKPEAAGEPSMEEILASIRKIIAEEPPYPRSQMIAEAATRPTPAGAMFDALPDDIVDSDDDVLPSMLRSKPAPEKTAPLLGRIADAIRGGSNTSPVPLSTPTPHKSSPAASSPALGASPGGAAAASEPRQQPVDGDIASLISSDLGDLLDDGPVAPAATSDVPAFAAAVAASAAEKVVVVPPHVQGAAGMPPAPAAGAATVGERSEPRFGDLRPLDEFLAAAVTPVGAAATTADARKVATGQAIHGRLYGAGSSQSTASAPATGSTVEPLGSAPSLPLPEAAKPATLRQDGNGLPPLGAFVPSRVETAAGASGLQAEAPPLHNSELGTFSGAESSRASAAASAGNLDGFIEGARPRPAPAVPNIASPPVKSPETVARGAASTAPGSASRGAPVVLAAMPAPETVRETPRARDAAPVVLAAMEPQQPAPAPNQEPASISLDAAPTTAPSRPASSMPVTWPSQPGADHPRRRASDGVLSSAPQPTFRKPNLPPLGVPPSSSVLPSAAAASEQTPGAVVLASTAHAAESSSSREASAEASASAPAPASSLAVTTSAPAEPVAAPEAATSDTTTPEKTASGPAVAELPARAPAPPPAMPRHNAPAPAPSGMRSAPSFETAMRIPSPAVIANARAPIAATTASPESPPPAVDAATKAAVASALGALAAGLAASSSKADVAAAMPADAPETVSQPADATTAAVTGPETSPIGQASAVAAPVVSTPAVDIPASDVATASGTPEPAQDAAIVARPAATDGAPHDRAHPDNHSKGDVGAGKDAAASETGSQSEAVEQPDAARAAPAAQSPTLDALAMFASAMSTAGVSVDASSARKAPSGSVSVNEPAAGGGQFREKLPATSGRSLVAPAPAMSRASVVEGDERTLEDTVAELLRPMLRQWLSDNMPRIVEKALRIELAQSLRQPPGSRQD